MSTPLIVPITLDILLAPKVLLDRDELRWWRFQYSNLNSFKSPEPHGFGANITHKNAGAYLHWTLPRSLRTSKASNSSDFPLVPNRWLIVRIHRDTKGNNLQRSWVLESDCPANTLDNSSLFLISENVKKNWEKSIDNNRKGATPRKISPGFSTGSVTDTGVYTVNLGVPFALKDWREQSPNNMFLTSVAPGNIEFSGYVPHNLGIFSFYDDLSDVPAQATLSYLVTGWYSDPKSDILTTGPDSFTGGKTITDVLNKLNWTIAQGKHTDTASFSLYNGMAFGLPWDTKKAPAPDPLEGIGKNVTVAIGNNGVDAFTTLVATQLNDLPDYKDMEKVIELLRAFQYDLLPELNNINGDAILAKRVRQEWFNARSGGTQWKIVAKKNNDEKSAELSDDAINTTYDPDWLSALNRNQKKLDDAIKELNHLQWDLNEAWWKEGFLGKLHSTENLTGLTKSDMASHLDPTQRDKPLYKVLEQLKLINTLQENVPKPIYSGNSTPQDAYKYGIASFAKDKDIPQGFELKAVSVSRFWKSRNPGILISGVQADNITKPDNNLEIRLSSQIIPSFKVKEKTITTTALGGIIPTFINDKVVPREIINIYKEFFLLDPSNAKKIAEDLKLDKEAVLKVMLAHKPTDYPTGALPEYLPAMWTQQWNPLYIEWEITPMHVPYEWKTSPSNIQGIKNWNFNGNDYDLIASPKGTSPFTPLSGRSVLSPHTQLTFGAKLKSFIDQYGSEEDDLTGIYEQIKGIDNWRFLSHELMNFDELLTQRDPRTFRCPTVETFTVDKKTIKFAKVIGYPDESSLPPYDTPTFAQSFVTSVPAVLGSSKSQYPFHGIRSGQFYINRLSLYDKFGRKLDVIVNDAGATNSGSHFPLLRDKAVKVSNSLFPKIQAPFQLPPRLLQHAKLDLKFIHNRNDNNVIDLETGVNPICGWIINNHLDHSILLFLPDGTHAGKLTLVQKTTVKTVQWQSTPGKTDISINDIKSQSEQLYSFITALKDKSAIEFSALKSAIDSTLWTTDPLGNRTDQNLSALIGRPLALVRTRLQFLLEGRSIKSCDWPKFLKDNPNIPPYTSSTFSIRMGDQDTREDGVIGYFEDKKYTVFNSVVKPLKGQDFVKQIGPVGSTNGNYIHLPFDGKTNKLITLLVDPRGAIHATTGILPVKEIQLPVQFVNKPLTAMEITFSVGPLLSSVQEASIEEDEKSPFTHTINYLPIAEKNGSWAWWQDTGNTHNRWRGYSLATAPTAATLHKSPATLHDGYLQFITDLKPGQ
jgi:hypothetical protein